MSKNIIMVLFKNVLAYQYRAVDLCVEIQIGTAFKNNSGFRYISFVFDLEFF
jgi:hypothetical protein